MKAKRMLVVCPVYNEAGNIQELLRQIDQAVSGLPYRFTVLFVNDGSDAETRSVLALATARRRDVAVIHLSRNFGHQAALTAGLEEALQMGAAAAICMDADLQHPPRLIPELIARWESGFDVVYTVRDDHAKTGWAKRMSSSLFYRIFSWLSETDLAPGAADFRLLSRPALEALVSLPEKSRFLRGLTSWIGFEQVAVHYQPEARFSGRSKYTIARMWRLALDGILSMSTVPLRAILVAGICLSLVSLTYLVYVLGAHFLTDRTIPGWSSVIVAVLLLGGMNLTVLGIMGLYIAKIYDEVKGRPRFLVQAREGDLLGGAEESNTCARTQPHPEP